MTHKRGWGRFVAWERDISERIEGRLPFVQIIRKLTLEDYLAAIGETVLTLLLSAIPIGLAALTAYATTTGVDPKFFLPMVKTAMKGDTLYVYAISTIGPVLYRIHRHLDGERAFPDSLVVSLIMVGIMAISVLFFALIRTGVPLDPHAIRQWPVAMYCLSMVFFYYTGVVNAYRERVASPGAAKEEAEKDEARFSESYAERHR